MLAALEDLSECGWAPTYREMLERLGWSPNSKGSLHEYLRRLRDLGVISGSGRSLRVLPAGGQNDRSEKGSRGGGAAGFTRASDESAAEANSQREAADRRRGGRPLGRERTGARPERRSAGTGSGSEVEGMEGEPPDSSGELPAVTALLHSVLRAGRCTPRHGLPPADQIDWWDRGVRDGIETAMVYAEEALRATAEAVELGDWKQARLITGVFRAVFETAELPRRDDGRLEQTSLIVVNEPWARPLAGPNLQLLDAFREAVSAVLGQPGRMIAESKTAYARAHRDHLVVFNANLCLAPALKVWHGDLDLTIDEPKLQALARTLSRELYILYESDGRFAGGDISPLIENAVYVAHPDGGSSLGAAAERAADGTLRKRAGRKKP